MCRLRLESRVGFVGPVAQGLEQSAHNRSVGGSIPSGPTTVCGRCVFESGVKTRLAIWLFRTPAATGAGRWEALSSLERSDAQSRLASSVNRRFRSLTAVHG